MKVHIHQPLHGKDVELMPSHKGRIISRFYFFFAVFYVHESTPVVGSVEEKKMKLHWREEEKGRGHTELKIIRNMPFRSVLRNSGKWKANQDMESICFHSLEKSNN